MSISSTLTKIAAIVVGGIVLGAVISLLFAFPTEWCWNYTMPYLFHLPRINWGRAWCLTFLAGMLIKQSSMSSSSSKS